MGVMLRVAGLSFAHSGGGRRLVDIDLEIERGDVHCILGPNGSGKTTLLRCLLGGLRPASGSVTVEGVAIGSLPPRLLARRIAVVPQTSQSVFGHLVLEMVLMGRSARLPFMGTPGPGDRAAAERALDRVGIAHLAGRPFGAISGGEQQLCLIARALAQEAPLLVLDEPAASLDLGNQIRILEIISTLAGEGYGVLMTTHHPDHALHVGTRVLGLREGRVFGAGRPDTLLTAQFLSGLYGAPVRVIRDRDGTLACIPALPGRSSESRPCHIAS